MPTSLTAHDDASRLTRGGRELPSLTHRPPERPHAIYALRLQLEAAETARMLADDDRS